MVKSRKCFAPYIYYLRYDRYTLKVGTEEFPDKVLTTLCDRKDGLVIWENQGAFKLIPAAILLNLLHARHASQQIKESYPRAVGPQSLNEITWSQGLPIAATIAGHLLLTPCKEPNELDDTNSDTGPAGEDQPDHP